MNPLVRTLALAVLVAATGVAAGSAAAPAHASATPPPGPITAPVMGWNSWNRFGCNIDENLIRQTADAIIANNLDDLGYRYVNIDDCWMAATRDAQGRLQPHPTRFAGGIRALADYVHARGLKLGIYSSAGTLTCQGLPASLDREVIDAQTFADWQIDLLKYDNCNNQGRPAAQRYKAMGDALKATGRHIVYSVCNWGQEEPWLFGPNVGGGYWRTTGDIADNWGSVLSLLDQQVGLETFARKGFFNDPDMLEVGNGEMTQTEYTAHFSLWALLSSPLLLGNDLRSMSAATLSIIRNAEVLAVNQDWGGSQGRKLRDFGDTEVWAKPMSDGSVAVVLFNRGGAAATVTTSASELGLGGSSSYGIRNLWGGATSTSTGTISASVPSHGVVMYRVSRAGTLAAGPGGIALAVSDLPWLASSNGWGPAERDRSNGEQAAGDGAALQVGGVGFAKGIGTHADSAVHVYLGRNCRTFTAQVGVDAESGANGSVRFAVYGDGRLLGYTGVRSGGQAPVRLSVSVAGVLALELRVADARNGISYDHADWGAPTVVCGTTGTGSYLSDRTWSAQSNGWGPVERDQSNGEQPSSDGSVLSTGGVFYPKGLGVHAAAEVSVPVAGGCSRFTAVVGIDAETAGRGSVVFSVFGDGVSLYASPVVTSASGGVLVDVPVAGRSTLRLVVANGGDTIDFDHANWAEARLLC